MTDIRPFLSDPHICGSGGCGGCGVVVVYFVLLVLLVSAGWARSPYKELQCGRQERSLQLYSYSGQSLQTVTRTAIIFHPVVSSE